VVMSATLDAHNFASYFGAKILYVEGRQFSVQLMYTLEPEPDYLDAAFLTVLQVHTKKAPGDVLVFLPGQEDIEAVASLLESRQKQAVKQAEEDVQAGRQSSEEEKLYRVCCMYAALPPEKQMAVFEPAPAGVRKIVLATNIAETSITINGIKYVVDCGLVKSKTYNPKTGLEALLTIPVSKAAARQRAGRAGREQEGVCYRLYTEGTYEKLREQTQPEIKRCSLDHLVLQLKALGVADVLNFDYMDPPPLESLSRALERLLLLGALDVEGALSRPLGHAMAQFPLAPMYGKTLFSAKGFGCTSEVLSIVAMLSVDTIFHMPFNQRSQAEEAKRRFTSREGGDHLTLLNVYNAYLEEHVSKRHAFCRQNFLNERSISKAVEIRNQLQDYCTQMEIDPRESCWLQSDTVKDPEPIRRCFLSGFFLHTAIKDPSGLCYRTVLENKLVYIHPSSVLFNVKPNCVVYADLISTSKHYMHDVIPIQESWIQEVLPNYQRDAF
ncbi:MAG: oligonucleotide/oligosaccharide-binding fold domain-containing protein, partial [archaeon]|nr:oligonucleotide/oligosaccharide-binding fold domain-containing protein [archaeon]